MKNKKTKTEEIAKEEKKKKAGKKGFWGIVKEWTDALVIAYVLAMFIRTYVGEPFKIPTGSMTPTLVGDRAADFDYDGDGEKDLVLLKIYEPSPHLHIFYKKNGKYVRNEKIYQVSPSVISAIDSMSKIRNDMIIVNKFAYWFKTPKRGDIVVFRVPNRPGGIWNRLKPIYIKRCVGFPGERISIEHPYILADGKVLDEPEIFRINEYVNDCSSKYYTSEVVPENQIYVFGDNSKNSLDSRYWGGVPFDNIKGKAFLRYWPLNKFKFLK